MTEIDWSKAPEGAQYARLVQGRTPDFYRTAVEFEFWCEDGNKWKRCDWRSASDADMIQRPTPWTGDGLPPVGTVCEVACSEGVWHVSTVVAHLVSRGRQIAVCQAEDIALWCGNGVDCRPIRTPEQIAAEEREKAVAAMLELDPYLPNTTLGMMSRADFCRTLYDNNYRKVEGVSQ